MGKQPVKRQREPSPPSSESEASDVSEHEDGGLPIPLLDLAIISDLRKREIEGPLATLKQHASMYREVHRKWRTHVTDYVAQSVGPSVTAEINKSGECPFYTMVMENAFRMGEEFVQSKSLKLTSLAMNNEHAQGAYGKKDSITPFQVSDIMPNVRFDDGDELFANQIRGVTIEYFLDEATKDAGAYHATQYEFHFVKDAKKPFSNTSLKVRFITLGGYFYRQATLTLGRIVDVQADSVEWTDKATKEEFLKNSAPFSLFRVLFCNTLPKIPEGKFVVPASSIAAHGIVEQYLGSTASLPNSDINMVDVEVLHRQFPVDGKGIVFPRASEAKPSEKGNGYVAAKLAKYLDIIRKTSVVAQRTKEADLDVVRLVVLLNATLYYTVTTILFNIADNPVELSLQPPMDDDEEDEEGDEEDEEGDEEDEEGDDEEDEEDDGSDDDDSDAGVVPSKPTGPAPPKKAAPGKQQPECKQQ